MARSRGPVEWVEVARRGIAHHLFVIDAAAELYRKKLFGKAHGVSWNPRHYRQFDHARWFSQDDWQSYLFLLRTGEERRPGYLLRLAHEFERRITAHRQFGKRYSRVPYHHRTSRQLSHIVARWFWHMTQFWCFAYDYIFINKFLPEEVMGEVSKKVPNTMEQNRILGTLFMADTLSEQWREKRSLVDIASRIRKSKMHLTHPSVVSDINAHVKTFGHLGLYYFRGRPYSGHDISVRLHEYVKLPARAFSQLVLDLRLQESNASHTKKIINTLRLNPTTIRKIRTIKRWGALSNYVDETYGYVVNALMPLWKEIEKRMGLGWDELFSLRANEIVHALRKGHLSKELKRKARSRFSDHAIILDGGTIRVLEGARLAAYRRKEKKTEKISYATTELRGQPASPGKARGRVRVVYTLHDLDKVERGDIVVTDATNPTYVPAMERASAIVTDEGGLLSHAAIVSRELRIPCVVGTKIGTKALKDGDIVSVDAERGIIIKL